MNGCRLRSMLPVLASVVLLASCAGMHRVEQRTTQGPSAREMWYLRMMVQNGREPTLEERLDWEDHLDSSLGKYLNEHPEFANSLGVTALRFDRRVVVGMNKELVLLLLDAPVAITTDQMEMEKLARRYWSAMKGSVTEAWAYPLGWNLYFAGSRLVEITQYDAG